MRADQLLRELRQGRLAALRGRRLLRCGRDLGAPLLVRRLHLGLLLDRTRDRRPSGREARGTSLWMLRASSVVRLPVLGTRHGPEHLLEIPEHADCFRVAERQ